MTSIQGFESIRTQNSFEARTFQTTTHGLHGLFQSGGALDPQLQEQIMDFMGQVLGQMLSMAAGGQLDAFSSGSPGTPSSPPGTGYGSATPYGPPPPQPALPSQPYDEPRGPTQRERRQARKIRHQRGKIRQQRQRIHQQREQIHRQRVQIRRQPRVVTQPIFIQQPNAGAFSTGESPLVLDRNQNGRFTDPSRRVRYDIDGDGRKDLINDVDRDDLLLTFDADGNGLAGEDGTELLGNNTDLNGDGRADGSYANGFEALEALAQKDGRGFGDDGVLDADELQALNQRWGLAVRQGGLNGGDVSLAEAGVQSIHLGTGDVVRENADARNQLDRRAGAGATLVDDQGQRQNVEMADVWFKPL